MAEGYSSDDTSGYNYFSSYPIPELINRKQRRALKAKAKNGNRKRRSI